MLFSSGNFQAFIFALKRVFFGNIAKITLISLWAVVISRHIDLLIVR